MTQQTQRASVNSSHCHVMFRRLSVFTCSAIALLGVALPGAVTQTHAEVITGTHSYPVGVWIHDPAFEFGDGVNHVSFLASFGIYFPWDQALWIGGARDPGPSDDNPYPFYSHPTQGYPFDTQVVHLPYVSDPSAIDDASVYTFTGGILADPVQAETFSQHPQWPDEWDPAWDKEPVFGVPGLILLHNVVTGHYGAVRIDMVDNFGDPDFFPEGFGVVAHVTWWFQTDGSADLSTVSPACPADLAGDDGAVNVFDLIQLLNNWGTSGAGADLAEPNDVVNVLDLFELLNGWGDC